MAKNLIVSALAALLAFAACELGVRLIYRDVTTTRDNRSYFAMRWKRDRVRLNRRGFRDREFEPEKRDGTFRIAVVGDSFTFGQGIEEDQRFSNLMAGTLRKRRPNIEVLNFGRAGNNTSDHLRSLNQHVVEHQPDFVLMQWYINDVEGNGVSSSGASPAPPTGSTVNDLKQGLLAHFATYFLFSEVVHRVRAVNGQSYERELFERVGDPESREWRAAEAAFREFVRVCRQHMLEVGVVLVPDLAPISDHYRYAYLHDRMLGLCREEGVTCVDLLPVFEPYLRNPDRFDELWVNAFDSHMSPHANQLTADHVVETFGSALAP